MEDSKTIKHILAKGVTQPLPIFSHATVYNGLVHVSCVQGFIPESFDFPGDDAGRQAEQMIKNLQIILEQAGSRLERVLKITIFFIDIKNDFPVVNEIINKYFPVNPPARSSIGVAELPRNAKVVIECCAAVH